MENKYYTPNSKEFYIGFEYEWFDSKKWNKTIFEELAIIQPFKSGNTWIETLIKENILRVKLLDKEDIENFGFVLQNNENNIWKFSNLNISLFVSFTDIITGIEIKCSDYTIFNGKIKNKNEFKTLLRQLEINES